MGGNENQEDCRNRRRRKLAKSPNKKTKLRSVTKRKRRTWQGRDLFHVTFRKNVDKDLTLGFSAAPSPNREGHIKIWIIVSQSGYAPTYDSFSDGVEFGSREQHRPDFSILYDLSDENEWGIEKDLVGMICNHYNIPATAVASTFLGVALFTSSVKSNIAETMCVFSGPILKALHLHVPRISESSHTLNWPVEIQKLKRHSKSSRAYKNQLKNIVNHQLLWASLTS